MPDPGGDYLAGVTTAPIFDDAVYLAEALKLPTSQNEDDLDAELALRARESGVEDPYRHLCPDPHDISTAMSTLTVDSEQRSSMSIHSQETQYTGFTSHPSRTSRDHTQVAQVERSPALRTPPPPPLFYAPTTSLIDGYMYDAVMEHFRPNARHRHSSSNVSAATQSVTSNSSLAKNAPRKFKRGSGFLSMFRKDSSSCSSRSHHGHHGKPLSPKLECGHSLSKYALRLHIQEALDSKHDTLPTCCGRELPRSVLELVLTKEEADVVTSHSAVQSPEVGSLRDSGYSENGMSSIDLPRPLDVLSLPTSFVTAPATPNPAATPPVDEELLKNALANEAFQALKAQQQEQYHRVSDFESTQRRALLSFHQQTVKRLATQHESSIDTKTKQHIVELERLEEFQLVAEHDLRRAHAQEVQNVETALKYMGAYCSGTNPIHPELAHTPTEEDQKALARQRMTQQKLPGKHESAINVLRAKQERDTKLKLEKQQGELDQIDFDYEKEKRAEESQYTKDTIRLDAVMEARRKRLRNRWDLQFEIWRKEWESQNGTILNGQLPHVEWPEKKTDDDIPIDSSSTLALFLLTVN